MSMHVDTGAGRGAGSPTVVKHDLHHLGSHWWVLLLLGILMAALGTAAIVSPTLTVMTTVTATILVGVLLMVGGVAMVVSSFWVGKWGGFLLQLFVGLLYVACGFLVTERPAEWALVMTVFIAVSFIVMGIFRSIASLVLRFPQWGWSLLNGVVTLLAGVVIYRQLPFDAFWVIGLLVGLEMLFNGWTWIMLALAVRGLTRDHA